MASKHTEKYLLNQWEGSDQVLRTDFNEDNLKIEKALAGRNCRCYAAAYTGNGANVRTHTFSNKPLFVVLMGNGCLTMITRGAQRAHTIYNTLAQRSPTVTWGENSVKLDSGSESCIYINNVENISYTIFAILELV